MLLDTLLPFYCIHFQIDCAFYLYLKVFEGVQVSQPLWPGHNPARDSRKVLEDARTSIKSKKDEIVMGPISEIRI